ncbi:MAG: hypothetical protein ACEY3D_07605 [Rickettsia sp.]|uniref:hypothetical protein n=1 Tax=Rickettsia sp. TaxID=789 RepID=UPI0039796346
MSFPRRRESSKTYKNLLLYVYFVKYVIFVPMLRLFFWIPAYAGMTQKPLPH